MMSGNTDFKRLGDDMMSMNSDTELVRGGSVYNGSKMSDTSFNRIDAVDDDQSDTSFRRGDQLGSFANDSETQMMRVDD